HLDLHLSMSRKSQMGIRDSAHVEANFSLARMVDDTLAIYAGLLGRAGPA
ncbi:glycosyltransferase family 4 protein, partial [Methylobacterium sp. WL122]